jgi:hypothetical protein
VRVRAEEDTGGGEGAGARGEEADDRGEERRREEDTARYPMKSPLMA